MQLKYAAHGRAEPVHENIHRLRLLFVYKL